MRAKVWHSYDVLHETNKRTKEPKYAKFIMPTKNGENIPFIVCIFHKAKICNLYSTPSRKYVNYRAKPSIYLRYTTKGLNFAFSILPTPQGPEYVILWWRHKG